MEKPMPEKSSGLEDAAASTKPGTLSNSGEAFDVALRLDRVGFVGRRAAWHRRLDRTNNHARRHRNRRRDGFDDRVGSLAN